MRSTQSEYLYIGDDVFSKETFLITLEHLHYLQTTCLKQGVSPSHFIGALIQLHKETSSNE